MPQIRGTVYREVAVSEQQIETGHVKDARIALAEMRKKNGLWEKTGKEERKMQLGLKRQEDVSIRNISNSSA